MSNSKVVVISRSAVERATSPEMRSTYLQLRAFKLLADRLPGFVFPEKVESLTNKVYYFDCAGETEIAMGVAYAAVVLFEEALLAHLQRG